MANPGGIPGSSCHASHVWMIAFGSFDGLNRLSESGMAATLAFNVVEERARLRNQGSEEGLQDSLHLVVRHDPDACSGQQRLGRRVENSSIRRRLVRHSRVPSFDEHVSYRLPTVWQVLVGVDDDTHDIVFLVGSPELDRDAVEEPFDVVMGSHFVKMRNATTPTDVLENMLVRGAFHQEDLATHVSVPRCVRESRWPPRLQ